MSGFATAALNAANALTSWRNKLRPSSFRGVPFYVDTASGSGGRRLVTHEFPMRDLPFTEDLGKAANKYRIRAFVVGNTYLATSKALLAACQDYDTPATFMHPWRGPLMCRAGVLSWHETKDEGGYCAFDIEFTVDTGALPSPTARTDTASTLLSGIARMLSLGIAAYATASLILTHPALLLGFTAGLLGDLGSALTGLPASVISGLTQAVAAVLLAPGDDTATATAVSSVMQSAAANAVTAATPQQSTDDPILGLSPLLAPAADPSGGLAALTTWGNSLPTPANPIQAAQLGAVQAMVRGQAVLAVLTVYAQLDWPSAQAAANARTQVRTMLDAQLDLAAAQGQDDLYRGWQALGSQAMLDLITRAQALPDLISYQMLASQPSLALAWRWYQDAGRGDELELLNDVPDPMFMPFSGVRLSS